MANIRTHNTYTPWILSYLQHNLAPFDNAFVYQEPGTYLCVIRSITRKLEINSYTQNTTECENELVVADGRHSIKCYFKGYLGKMYIENKIVNLKSFHVEIDDIMNQVYFVVSQSEISKPNIRITDIYNIYTRDINTEHNVHKLLNDHRQNNTFNTEIFDYTQNANDYTQNYTENAPNFAELSAEHFTLPEPSILFPPDFNGNEPPKKRQKFHHNSLTLTPQTQPNQSTEFAYNNMPKFIVSPTQNTFSEIITDPIPNMSHQQNVNAFAERIQPHVNNVDNVNHVNNVNITHKEKYQQRMNAFCDGIEQKMKPYKQQQTYDRKMNAFADSDDDTTHTTHTTDQFIRINKKNDNMPNNICNYNCQHMSPQSSAFCPLTSQNHLI